MQVAAIARRRVPQEKQHLPLSFMRARVQERVGDPHTRSMMLNALSHRTPPMAFPEGVDATSLGRLPRRALVGLKADGDRAALLLFTLPSGSGAAVFIDRGGSQSRVAVQQAPPNAFDGTWLDVELVLDKTARRLMVLILDCVFECGEYVGGLPFRQRSRRAAAVESQLRVSFSCCRMGCGAECTNPYAPVLQLVPCTCMFCSAHAPSSEYDPEHLLLTCPACGSQLSGPQYCAPLTIDLQQKPLYDPEDVRLAWSSRTALDYGIDGVVIHDADAPLPVGRTTAFLKWKPKEMTTVDMQFVWGADGALLTAARQRDPQFAVEPVRDGLASDLCVGEEYVGEFSLGERDGQLWLTLLRLRKDKAIGNSAVTIERTVSNFVNAAAADDLFTALCG